MKTDLFKSDQEEREILDALASRIRSGWFKLNLRPAPLEKIREDLDKPCHRAAIALHLKGKQGRRNAF